MEDCKSVLYSVYRHMTCLPCENPAVEDRLCQFRIEYPEVNRLFDRITDMYQKAGKNPDDMCDILNTLVNMVQYQGFVNGVRFCQTFNGEVIAPPSR